MGASPYIKENLQAAFLLILTVTFLWVSNYTFDKKIAPLGDNAAYYLLGKSLAEGTGYTDLHGIEPATAYHFPPGYPVIIAGAIKFIGANVVGVKAINSLFLLSSILLFFFIIKRVTGNLHMAFVTGMICVLNVQLLTFSTDIRAS